MSQLDWQDWVALIGDQGKQHTVSFQFPDPTTHDYVHLLSIISQNRNFKNPEKKSDQKNWKHFTNVMLCGRDDPIPLFHFRYDIDTTALEICRYDCQLATLKHLTKEELYGLNQVKRLEQSSKV